MCAVHDGYYSELEQIKYRQLVLSVQSELFDQEDTVETRSHDGERLRVADDRRLP